MLVAVGVSPADAVGVPEDVRLGVLLLLPLLVAVSLAVWLLVMLLLAEGLTVASAVTEVEAVSD